MCIFLFLSKFFSNNVAGPVRWKTHFSFAGPARWKNHLSFDGPACPTPPRWKNRHLLVGSARRKNHLLFERPPPAPLENLSVICRPGLIEKLHLICRLPASPRPVQTSVPNPRLSDHAKIN